MPRMNASQQLLARFLAQRTNGPPGYPPPDDPRDLPPQAPEPTGGVGGSYINTGGGPGGFQDILDRIFGRTVGGKSPVEREEDVRKAGRAAWRAPGASGPLNFLSPHWANLLVKAARAGTLKFGDSSSGFQGGRSGFHITIPDEGEEYRRHDPRFDPTGAFYYRPLSSAKNVEKRVRQESKALTALKRLMERNA